MVPYIIFLLALFQPFTQGLCLYLCLLFSDFCLVLIMIFCGKCKEEKSNQSVTQFSEIRAGGGRAKAVSKNHRNMRIQASLKWHLIVPSEFHQFKVYVTYCRLPYFAICLKRMLLIVQVAISQTSGMKMGLGAAMISHRW